MDPPQETSGRRFRVVAARAASVALVVAVPALGVACGGTSPSTTPTATATISLTPVASATPAAAATAGGVLPAGQLDPCLVGTWTSVKATVKLAYEGGVTLSGGTGEVLTVEKSGAYTDDNHNVVPPQVDTASGHQYKVDAHGVAAGRLSTSSGTVTVTTDDPARLPIDVYVDGFVVASTHPPTLATETYVCGADGTLTIASTDGTAMTVYRRS